MPCALDNMTYTREPVDLLEQEMINHCVCHKTSFLCAKIYEKDYELRVFSSHQGWYIGGEVIVLLLPGARDSQFFATEEDAQWALDNRCWEQRMDP